jgi:hypothetical protein
MSRNRYSVQINTDVEVNVSDIFDELDYQDLMAHIDIEEFIGQLDEKILIKHLEEYGYTVTKDDL